MITTAADKNILASRWLCTRGRFDRRFNDWNTSGEVDSAFQLAKQFDLHKTFLSTLAPVLPLSRGPCHPTLVKTSEIQLDDPVIRSSRRDETPVDSNVESLAVFFIFDGPNSFNGLRGW